MAQIAGPLAAADISAYYISTFNFDHALVSPLAGEGDLGASYCKQCCKEQWDTCFPKKNSISVLVSSGYMPSSGITGSYGDFIPSF